MFGGSSSVGRRREEEEMRCAGACVLFMRLGRGKGKLEGKRPSNLPTRKRYREAVSP